MSGLTKCVGRPARPALTFVRLLVFSMTVAACFANPAHAAEPTGWHGARWGMSMDEAKRIFPNWKAPDISTGGAFTGIWVDGPVDVIPGVHAGTVAIGFYNGKLCQFKFFPMKTGADPPVFAEVDVKKLIDYVFCGHSHGLALADVPAR